MARHYVIWDFDGTLGYRDGGMWSGTLLEILADERPDINATVEMLRAHVGRGYPWHTPERPHPEWQSAADWWEAMLPVLQRALTGVGVPEAQAAGLVRQFPARYTELARWRLFSDTLPTLTALSAAGWRHVVLSNHVPELPRIIAHLGLDAHLEALFNSAQTGYEKPHPQAFRAVLDFIGPVDAVWMIGDNPRADIAGAAAHGIPGILVRTTHPDVSLCCADLAQIPALLA
jgi:putative hydrolase of the HAD superfamily